MSSSGQRRIVVGVSGSRASVAALRWAAQEARQRHARLEVVRVCEAPPRLAPYAGAGAVPAEAARITTSRELALITSSALGAAGAAAARLIVEDGLTVRALIARCEGADMLVLGAHTPQDRINPAAGPVIRGCLHRTCCPVVIVPARTGTTESASPAPRRLRDAGHQPGRLGVRAGATPAGVAR